MQRYNVAIVVFILLFACIVGAEEKVYTDSDLDKYKTTASRSSKQDVKAFLKNPCVIHLQMAQQALSNNDDYMYDFSMRGYDNCVHPPVRVQIVK